MKQSDKAKITLREMEAELKRLKQPVSFREYIGYELCVKKFKERYMGLLNRV